MFEQLEKINTRPEPFAVCTTDELWTDEHTSAQMLRFHLDPEIDVSSRSMRFIDRSVEWQASRFNIGPGTKIADFGCGPGLYAERLARRHAAVTGIDFSQRSIEYARKTAEREGLAVHYINRNYLDFETDDRFDLILMIMCDYCALGPAQRGKMLSTFHRLLEPSGSLLFDVYSLAAFRERRETALYEVNLLNGFWSPDHYYGFLNTFKYEKEKVVLDKYTIVEAVRTRTIYNWLQYFSPEDLGKELRENGFAVDGCYADVAGTPFSPAGREFAVIAGKR